MTLPRVLSYPPVHDYVDRLHDHAAELVHRDEPWPRLPRFYDPVWVSDRAGSDWDVAHLHFTWEQHDLATVAAVLDAHRAAGVPIVWTAHDVRNPHTEDAERDRPYLELLAERADEVLTLTRGAAREVERRFGRPATVIPHGPILEPGAAETVRGAVRPTSGSPRLRVLVHAKSLRANLDLDAVLEASRRLADRGVPIDVTVTVHRDEVDVTRLRDRAGAGAAIVPQSRLSLDELARQIASVDVLLLPYRWGTHSGMVELATDVATFPVVSDVGHLAEQAPCRRVRVRDGRVDAEDLARVLTQLAHGRPPAPVAVVHRRRLLRDLRDRHRRLYERLASAGRDGGRAVR